MPRRLPRLKFPERIDASPEEVARVVLNAKPPKRWKCHDWRAKQVSRRKAELSDRGIQVERAE